MSWSKILWKWDDWAKLLLIELLDWAKTWWFDIDSMYCINWKYYVIEFLKCESKYPWITPFTSHPNKYWFNKQKFISLRNTTKKLNWVLYLINYETTVEWKIWDRFWLMEVIALDEDKWIKTIWIHGEKSVSKLNLNDMKKRRKEHLNKRSLNQ